MNSISVDKNAFKKAVTLSRKALSKIVIQEERGHLLFSVEGDLMSIQGTNNDLKARGIIDIENSSGETFSFTSDPKILEKLMSKIEVNTIRIDVDSDKNTIKVFTSDSKRSYTTLQSFLPSNMLTFGDPSKEERKQYTVDLKVFLFALKYSLNFMAIMKEDQKNFDFVTITKGLVFAANGSNKMGFMAANTFKPIPELKIRKQVVPMMVNFLMKLDGDQVIIVESGKDIGLESTDGKFYFSALKSNVEAPKINKEYIISSEPYVEIDKNRLMKVSDRVVINSASAAMIGLDVTLTGSGDDSLLELKLVSNTVESVEVINCSRKGDTDEKVTHIIDHKLLRTILGSFTTEKDIRFHICDKAKFWKVYTTGEIGKEKYIISGIGTYAKVVRN